MDRETTLRLFLGLAEAVDEGIVTDVLWMGGGDNSTIFEQLYTAVQVPDDIAELGDTKTLIRWLRVEIDKGPRGRR